VSVVALYGSIYIRLVERANPFHRLLIQLFSSHNNRHNEKREEQMRSTQKIKKQKGSA
jgi:hypothetical protein